MPGREQPKPEIKGTAQENPPTTLRDLVSLAEFDAKRFKKAADETTNEKVKPGLQEDARAKAEVMRVLQNMNISSVDGALESLMGDIRSAEKLPSIPESVRKNIESKNRVIAFLAANRNVDLATRADFQTWRQEKLATQAKAAEQRGAARVATERTEATTKIEKVYQNLGVESPEARERELNEVIRLINQESAKVILASLKEEQWRKAGRKERLRTGSDVGVEGKRLVGFDPDTLQSAIDFFDVRGMGAPKSTELPDNPFDEYITYRVKELKQTIYEKRPTEITVEVPRRVLGIPAGTKKEKRTAIRDVAVGERPTKMQDRVVDGGGQAAFSISFRRPATEYSRRRMDFQVTAIVSRDIAERVSDLLRRNPKDADRLFEKILPNWIKDPAAEVSFKPSKHIGGELLPPKKK